MPEVEDHKEQFADWHPPEPEKPSRWGGALSVARNLGGRAKEAAAGAASKSIDAARNFDRDAALATARAALDRASSTGKGLVERGTELAGDFRDKTKEAFESERFQQLTGILQEALTSPEAQKVIRDLPFAGVLRIGEAGMGKTIGGETLSSWGRLKHGLGGAKDVAVDMAGGEIVKGAKIAAAALELSPAALKSLGNALQEKNVRGADTLAALANFMQEHPAIVGFLTRKFTTKH